jgi:hypothetical protein
MTALAIRKKLITYLADADDKKVKAVYSLFEDEINQQAEFKLSAAHKKILSERRGRQQTGKDSPTGWKESHARIRNKRNA